jgi:hypothetical protein
MHDSFAQKKKKKLQLYFLACQLFELKMAKSHNINGGGGHDQSVRY